MFVRNWGIQLRAETMSREQWEPLRHTASNASSYMTQGAMGTVKRYNEQWSRYEAQGAMGAVTQHRQQWEQ